MNNRPFWAFQVAVGALVLGNMIGTLIRNPNWFNILIHYLLGFTLGAVVAGLLVAIQLQRIINKELARK